MIKKGRGMATVLHTVGLKGNGDPDQAFIRLRRDGSFDLSIGDVDHGQGVKTLAIQFLAEAMRVPTEKITFTNENTKTNAFAPLTAASRSTFIMGNAVIKAATDLKHKMALYAAGRFDVPTEAIAFGDEKLFVRNAPEREMSFAQVGRESLYDAWVMFGEAGYMTAKHADPDPETGAVTAIGAFTFATMFADVEVDTETGAVDVTGLYSAYDVGSVVNPDLAEGQVWGGNAMGLGMAMTETLLPNYPLPDGGVSDFTDYIIPTAVDMDFLTQNVFVENYDPNGPFGAKGLGEMSSNPQPPAIANAICNACGIRITSLPITPEKVLRALDALEESKTPERR